MFHRPPFTFFQLHKNVIPIPIFRFWSLRGLILFYFFLGITITCPLHSQAAIPKMFKYIIAFWHMLVWTCQYCSLWQKTTMRKTPEARTDPKYWTPGKYLTTLGWTCVVQCFYGCLHLHLLLFWLPFYLKVIIYQRGNMSPFCTNPLWTLNMNAKILWMLAVREQLKTCLCRVIPGFCFQNALEPWLI